MFHIYKKIVILAVVIDAIFSTNLISNSFCCNRRHFYLNLPTCNSRGSPYCLLAIPLAWNCYQRCTNNQTAKVLRPRFRRSGLNVSKISSLTQTLRSISLQNGIQKQRKYRSIHLKVPILRKNGDYLAKNQFHHNLD